MNRYNLLKVTIAVMLAISALIASLTSCSIADNSTVRDSSERGTISVGVQSGLGFSVDGKSVYNIIPGGDVTFKIIPKEGFKIVGFSHPEYEKSGDMYTFKGILYPTVIEVYYTDSGSITDTAGSNTNVPSTSKEGSENPPVPVTEAETSTEAPVTTVVTTEAPNAIYPVSDPDYINSIVYVFNGGAYKGAEDSEYMTVFPDVTHHKRVNVISGKDVLTREGHTLAGWNTMPDGSGVHVSLGSRVTLNKTGAQVLYAEWYEWSDEGSFTYTVSSKKAKITGYSGSDELLVIPGTLGGAPVTAIAAGAFKNIPAHKIVFPSTISTVADGAFNGCEKLTVLHFFDTVTSIGDKSFENCEQFSTIYINMLKAPVYITSNGKVEAYDSMILSENKRIVFFAGSSCLYGINAHRAKESFGDEYDVINLGWTAPRNAMFQVQIIIALLREGDIFVHAPEYLGSYQLMRSVTMGTTAWQVIDCNLDLFSYVDIRTVPGVFSSFSKFTVAKDSATKRTFDDYCKSMDDLGYLSTNRKITHSSDWAPDGSIAIKASLLSDTAMTRLKWIYGSMKDKGATVYLTYPPLDINYLDEASRNPDTRQGYIDRYESLGCPVLGKLDDALYSGEYFYNTEFHLVTEGANMHTDRVVALLIEQMQKDGLFQAPDVEN